MRNISFLALCCAALLMLSAQAHAADFRFESYPRLDDMREFIIAKLPLGTPREEVRKTFVENGKATIITHPTHKQTEKYLYDIDICGAYLWRWNISADFDDGGKLAQAYINGNPVHMSGAPDPLSIGYEALRIGALKSKKITRPGAEKFSAITYSLQDSDRDFATTSDQTVSGPGYRAAMPYTFSEFYYYKNVFPWRSIFDEDASTKVTKHTQCADKKSSLPPVLELFMPDPSSMPKIKLPTMQQPHGK